MLYHLTVGIFGVWAGLTAVFLFTTYPFLLWLTKQPNSELPFLIFFYGSVSLAWHTLKASRLDARGKWLLAASTGLAAGGAALIRPAAIGLGAILAIFLLARITSTLQARLIVSGLALVGYLLAILPWQVIVYMDTGKIIPLSTGSVPSFWDGMTYAVDDSFLEQAANPIPNTISPGLEHLMFDLLTRAQQEHPDNMPTSLSILMQEIQQQPQAAMELIGLKMARSWYATESGRLEAYNLVIQAGYLLLALWGGCAAWKMSPDAHNYLLLILILTAYFWLMTVAVLSILRYMTPVMGLILTLIPAGPLKIHWLSNKLERFAS